MFIIPCKYNSKFPFVIQLVDDIRKYHPDEKIVVVDSSSDDKSYFADLEKYNVIIEDIDNKHWMIGAYWHSYIKYPNENFYFFMHDSMRVKSNLDYLKDSDLTLLMYFDRCGNYDLWGEKIEKESNYIYKKKGFGCYGPIYFCKNIVMKKMLDMGVDKFLPNNKLETWFCERIYGFFLEEQGYDLKKCSLFGDVFKIHSSGGLSGLPPHKTDWQYPVEKFYASLIDDKRK